MRRIYGTSGDEEVGEDDDPTAALAADPRLSLSTGFAISTAVGGLLLAIAWVWAGDWADLAGDRADSTLIVLAVAAGALGGLLRFGRYILRLQLRSGAYLAVSLVAALGSVAIAVPLLAEGLGIEAVLIGFLAANAASFAICLPLLRVDLRPAVSLTEAWEILRGGVRFLPVVFSFQAIQLGDTLLVANFASFADTGLYRVAQRIAMPVSYGTSVFQQAWGPMRRDMTQAAIDRLDEARRYAAHLMTYYAVFVVALVLVVAVFADQLVRLAASDFGEAATLVPLTTISVAGHGAFIFSYRNARLPRQMAWLVGLSLLAAAVFIGGAALLIPEQGAIGAPLAAIAGWGLATAIMLGANQAIGQPIPFEWRNLALLAGLSLAAWALSDRLLPDSFAGVLARVALMLVWAVALLALRVIPPGEVGGFARHIFEATGLGERRALRARLEALDGFDAVLVEELVRRQLPPAEVASRQGVSEAEVLACAVQALREAGGGGGPRDTDVALGELLLVRRPRAERDSGLFQLVAEHADPTDVDLILRAANVTRRGR